MLPIRIQKWLSQQGIASRREAERYIEEGRLQVNGKKASLGTKITIPKDQLRLDGKCLSHKKTPYLYWLLNKPDLTLVSRVSQNNFKTIYDLPAVKRSPFLLNPIGRLDFRTEGLLLLANDGQFIHDLTHPSSHIPRTYHTLVAGKLTKQELANINKKGLTLKDGHVHCKITFIRRQRLGNSIGSWYSVTVFEGRNRLIRRIFDTHLQMRVLRLIRISIGTVHLTEDLKPGKCRALKAKEVSSLKQLIESSHSKVTN